MQRVLVVAAHPDDEVLGCGAAIVRHTLAGDQVHVLFLADGVSARPQVGGAANVGLDRRMQAAQTASSLLGAEPPRFIGLADNRLDSLPLLDIVQQVERVVAEIQPQILYTHHAGDLNIDHRIAHQAVMTACRPVPGAPWRRILCFEVASSTEWQTPSAADAFLPSWFIDATNTLGKKLDALKIYEDELRPWPHPRSLQAIEYLARWRGASMGLEAAEAFMLVRVID